MTVKQELLALLEASSDKKLHAEDVVSWARRHPQSALHRRFEWNDKKAALEYRIWQARRLILIIITDEESQPQMVNLSIDRTKGGGYRAISEVLTSKRFSFIMLQDAIDELDRVKFKYSRVKELTSVWNLVDKIRAKAKRK